MSIINILKIVQCISVPALTVSEILTFKMFDFESVGQGYGVQLCNGVIRLQI